LCFFIYHIKKSYYYYYILLLSDKMLFLKNLKEKLLNCFEVSFVLKNKTKFVILQLKRLHFVS